MCGVVSSPDEKEEEEEEEEEEEGVYSLTKSAVGIMNTRGDSWMERKRGGRVDMMRGDGADMIDV